MAVKNTIATLALACAAAFPGAPAALAQTGPAEAPPQTVAVRGVRDPAIAPYAEAYDMLTRVRAASRGKADMVIRVLSEKTLQPMPDLELSLTGATISEKLSLSPEGFLDVPLDRRYLDDKAEFVTNQKKGEVRAEFYFVPLLPGGTLTYGDMEASIAAAGRAVKQTIPWYIRLFAGGIDTVRLCYPDATRTIALSDGTVRPASNEQKNMLSKETMYCASFGMREVAAAKGTGVTAPPGWVALFN